MKQGVFLLVLLSVLNGCICPEKDSAVPYKSFDPEFLHYTRYKSGSYWIYKEEGSGETDSVYITSYSMRTLVDSDLSDKTINTDQLTMTWVLNGQPWAGNTSVYKQEDEYVFIYSLKNLSSGVENVLYDHKTVRVNDSLLKTAFHSSIEYIENYSMQGKPYAGVKVFTAASEHSYFQKVYWAAHTGIIRMKLKDGREWVLIRSNAIQ